MGAPSPPACRARHRVSVLGVGAMGRLHARVFHQLEGEFALAGVYDPDAAVAGEVAEAWSARAYPSEQEAIAAADLVVVASPIESHAGAVRRAIAEGRHVLVEKPVCATAGHAFALARALRSGQRLFVGHSERWNPAVRALRRLVAPADIVTLRVRRTAPALRPMREHGALVSLGVHDLDLIAYLTRSPVAVRTVAHVDDDRADLVLTSASGAVAWLHVDRRAPQRERSLEVTTRDFVYSADLLTPSLDVTPRDGGPVRPCPLVTEEPLAAQARAIGRVLASPEGPCEVATGVDGARALLLVEQAMILGSRGALRGDLVEAS